MKAPYSVVGYTILFYGKEYFRESLLSVVNYVDKFVVLYTQLPSQGQSDDLLPEDTEEALKQIATEVLGDKLIWDSKEQYCHENEHRMAIQKYITDENVLLIVDADEIYEESTLADTIEKVANSDVRYLGVSGFINFWKAFDVYFDDGFTPIRFMNLKNGAGQKVINQEIFHFSCAQSIETIKYKWTVSGHKHELKKEWFDIYNSTDDLSDTDLSRHPVSYDIWKNPKKFDKSKMPIYLQEHKNFNKTII